jgi:hypothetical protein
MAKKKRFDLCTVQRTVLVTHGTFNLNTGEHRKGEQEWKTGPCNTPLFGEESRKTGVCSSCKKGWSVPNNYFADRPRPVEG